MLTLGVRIPFGQPLLTPRSLFSYERRDLQWFLQVRAGPLLESEDDS